MPEDRAAVLSDICACLTNGEGNRAVEALVSRYPFSQLPNAGRRYSAKELIRVFVRDGFIDRYTGQKLVFPGSLRLLSRLLPEHFPFHANWRTNACHFAYYELYPTLDHIIPISRGGSDFAENWATTSMLRNTAKANYTLAELGWTFHAPGAMQEWDGLTGWFLDWITRDRAALADGYLKRWHTAAVAMKFD